VSNPHQPPPKGRGASTNPAGRFESAEYAYEPDMVDMPADIEDVEPSPRTQFLIDASESLINYNDSPDISFRASLNAYRGCEHGCSYCYARPFHEYLGMSSGLDFETKIMVKTKAPVLLRKELSKKGWTPQVISMSGVTDCYQPAERKFQLTRRCLEVLLEYRNPVAIVTKNALITRDIDLLKQLAAFNCVGVFVSVTTLDPELAGKLEPRASRPQARLETIRKLSEAGVPVGVMMAPVIPGLNESEIPALLKAVAEAGAQYANYVLLRLPYKVKDIFAEWLEIHYPLRKEKILGDIRSTRDGELYDSDYGSRMDGKGVRASQIAQLFEVSLKRAGIRGGGPHLTTDHYRRLAANGQQELF